MILGGCIKAKRGYFNWSQGKSSCNQRNYRYSGWKGINYGKINFYSNVFYKKIGDTLLVATKPVREVGEKIKEYVPDITETEIAKKVSKSVSEAESKIMENTNIYQYGGFKSKTDREKLKEKLMETTNETGKAEDSSVPENPE